MILDIEMDPVPFWYYAFLRVRALLGVWKISRHPKSLLMASKYPVWLSVFGFSWRKAMGVFLRGHLQLDSNWMRWGQIQNDFFWTVLLCVSKVVR